MLGLVSLLGWNDLPLDPSSQAIYCFSHSVIMSGDTEMPVWPPHPMHSLSHQLVLRKPEHVRDSGYAGTWP